MKKAFISTLLALVLCSSAQALTISNQSIRDVWTATLPQVNGDVVIDVNKTYSANNVPESEDSGYVGGSTYNQWQRVSATVPGHPTVINSFSGTITVDMGHGSYRSYGPYVDKGPLMTNGTNALGQLKNILTISPVSKTHKFNLTSLSSTGSGTLTGDNEFEFNDCTFNFTNLVNYVPSYKTQEIATSVTYVSSDGYSYTDYGYGLGDMTSLATTPELLWYNFKDTQITYYSNRRSVHVEGGGFKVKSITATYNRDSSEQWLNYRYSSKPAAVPCNWAAAFSSRSCSVGSLQNLTFRGCGGANASFNGTVTRSLNVENSNLTNFNLSMSGNPTVNYSTANFSGQSSLSGAIGDLTIVNSNVGAGSFGSLNLLQKYLACQVPL